MSDTIFWEEVGVGSIDLDKKIPAINFYRDLTRGRPFPEMAFHV